MGTHSTLLLLFLSAAFVGCRADRPTAPGAQRSAALSAARAARAPLVVDDDRADCPDAQFMSIQAAVSAAATGDRIVVCAGTYHEQVDVSTNDLQIHADDESGEVVVNAHGHDFGFQVLNASGVTIAGFHVEHAHEADIFLRGATFATIRGNVTTASGHDGIELNASNDNVIEHNVSLDNSAVNACGIQLTAGSQRNVVRHNRVVNNEWGIQIAGRAADNLVADNMSVGNRGNGIRNVAGAAGTVIEKNHASGNGFNPSALTGTTNAGIRIASGSTGILVRDNHVSENLSVDLLNQAGSGATFGGNQCGTSSPAGLCTRPGRPTTTP